MDYDATSIAGLLGLSFFTGTDPEATASFHPPAWDGRSSASGLGLDASFTITIHSRPVQVVGDTVAARRATADWPDRVTVRASYTLIEKAVEHGLPRRSLQHVAELLAGDDRAKVAALESGVAPRSAADRQHDALSPQESERTERVARLFLHARRALGNLDEARQFMTSPHAELDGRTPVDASKTDLGTRRVEHLLNALEYGLAM